MKYMAVVECISSGKMYVGDILSRGYRPLIINMREASRDTLECRMMLSAEIGNRAEYIDEDEDQELFLSKLKNYDIIAVFAGSEAGVRLADRLNRLLGLRGNDDSTTYLRCNKSGMNLALEKAGLRRIESASVSCRDDITAFWEKHRNGKCVLRYAESAAAVGLRICPSLNIALDHYEHMMITPDYRGELNRDILIQEYVGGTEYIIDSLSCNGEHIITDMWIYSNAGFDNGIPVYDCIKLIKDPEPGHSDMVRYAYSVLDAVDMKWGICHMKIKTDENGPVLIETNARPIGLTMTADYLDEALGYHITDMAIDTYLEPERFRQLIGRPYGPRKYAMMKLMIVPDKIIGSFEPAMVLGNMIHSTREVLFSEHEGMYGYPRTNAETSPVVVKMIDEDYGSLTKDCELLRLIESNYFQLYYSVGNDIDGLELKTDLGAVIRKLDAGKRILVTTDGEDFIAYKGEILPNEGWQIFDGVIYAKCAASAAAERYRSVYRAMCSIRSGGIFIAVPESYAAMKHGSVMMDFMMNIGGFRIMLPGYGSGGIVYGIKK